MDRKEIRAYQLAQLKLLKFIHTKCNELGLDYYLFFGSLLGAVRHKGFIPWDVDIDVAMLRKDYEKLKEYFIKNPNEDVFYAHYDTERNHFSPHAILKIKGTHVVYYNSPSSRYDQDYDGIFIDIFPVDNVLEDAKMQKRQTNKIAFIRRIISLKIALVYKGETSQLKKVLKKLVSYSLSFISFKKLWLSIDKAMQEYDNIETEYVAILANPNLFQKRIFHREWFGKPKYLQFENEKFYAPSEPEKILTVCYGDYMTFPPEEKKWKYVEKVLKSVDYGNSDFLK